MEEVIILTHDISADDFTRTGETNSDVKRKLKQMGVSPDTIRKVTIAMYEGEINMVVHAKGGVTTVEITTEKIEMVLANVGPGIPDVKLAMRAGYPTAPNGIHSLGFRADMGLPDMKKYSDSVNIGTRIGERTTITMVMNLQSTRMRE